MTTEPVAGAGAPSYPTVPPADAAPVVDPAAAAAPPADPPTTPAAPNEPAPAASSATLPGVGSAVRYEAVDPVTGDELVGVGLVVDAYTVGEGDNQLRRVTVHRLSADLALSVDDIEPIN